MRIGLKQMEFYAYHGWYAIESKVGNLFYVDIEFNIEPEALDWSTDELLDTVDYETIYNIVKTEMEVTSKLIEHLAYRIKTVIQSSFNHPVKVKITKLQPQVGGKIASTFVEI